MFEIKVFRNNKFDIYKSKKPEFIVGRAADSDIIVSSDVISRYHLKIIVSADALLVLDLNSANGTYKNGTRIEPEKTYIITQFDKIRLGNMTEDIRIFDTRNEAVKEEKVSIKEPESKEPVPEKPIPSKEKKETGEDKESPVKANPAHRPPVRPIMSDPSKVFSLQEVSRQAEQIVEGAKKKAKEITIEAETEAEKCLNQAVLNGETIIKDAHEQATKIILNGEASAEVIQQKAQADYNRIVDQAHVQGKLIVDKSTVQAQMSLEESKRQGETLLKNRLLDLENEKIKLKQEWIKEQEQLTKEVDQRRDNEDNEFKKYLFSEREKLRKELDEKRTEFAKDLRKKQEKMNEEEREFAEKNKEFQVQLEALLKKQDELKASYAQQSLQVKIHVEDEKGKSEIHLSELKKKYDEEIESYKKKELDRINALLKKEQDQLAEKRKIEEVQFKFAMKKSVLSLLDQNLGKEIGREKANSLIQLLSEKFDHIDVTYTPSKKEKETEVKLDTEKTVQSRSSKTTWVVALSSCVFVLALFIFWEQLHSSLKKSETYTRYMFDKMQVESVYIPIQTKEWRNSYTDRILYLESYADFKTNQLYTDKWTQHLTNVENARLLKLNEDDMIRFIAREMNLVNQLYALQKTIDARQLDLGIAKLKAAESDAKKDFLNILKSEENVATMMKWEKQFVTEHMLRMQQQRLPSDSK